MTTFVDTSAFFAILAETDSGHDRAVDWLEETMASGDEHLLTHDYVVVESAALIHDRLGNAATRAFFDDVLPACEVRFVDQSLYFRSVSAYLAALGRQTSFVDRVSFEVMRELAIRRAFAFDRDFAREGFQTVPSYPA